MILFGEQQGGVSGGRGEEGGYKMTTWLRGLVGTGHARTSPSPTPAARGSPLRPGPACQPPPGRALLHTRPTRDIFYSASGEKFVIKKSKIIIL